MKKLITTLAITTALIIPTATSAHTIESGDTVYGISQANGMSLLEFEHLNPQVKDINRIYVGQDVYTVSTSERHLLAQIVEAEAKGEPYAGKVAVATVVLNRVVHDGFPDTVEEVIYQPGQFSPVMDGAINNTPSADSIRAVREALNTQNFPTATNSLFFWNPKTATSRWLESLPTTTVIGNHEFKASKY